MAFIRDGLAGAGAGQDGAGGGDGARQSGLGLGLGLGDIRDSGETGDSREEEDTQWRQLPLYKPEY